MAMEWKDFLNRNWSRKAEIVGLGLADVWLITRLDGIDKTVQMTALIIVAIITLAGLIIQGVLDWKHPKPAPGTTVIRKVGPLSITRANAASEEDESTDAVPVAKQPGE